MYDPSRKTASGILNYVSENVTALKNLAEYLMPGELGSLDELAPGKGGILRSGLSRIAAYRDRQRKPSTALGDLHACRLPRSMEFHRTVLGLPVPRLAIFTRRFGAQRPRHHASPGRRSTARREAEGRKAELKSKRRMAGNMNSLFTRIATYVAHQSGRPLAFLIAAVMIIAWALTGPLFDFSDTWQLHCEYWHHDHDLSHGLHHSEHAEPRRCCHSGEVG